MMNWMSSTRSLSILCYCFISKCQLFVPNLLYLLNEKNNHQYGPFWSIYNLTHHKYMNWAFMLQLILSTNPYNYCSELKLVIDKGNGKVLPQQYWNINSSSKLQSIFKSCGIRLMGVKQGGRSSRTSRAVKPVWTQQSKSRYLQCSTKYSFIEHKLLY